MIDQIPTIYNQNQPKPTNSKPNPSQNLPNSNPKINPIQIYQLQTKTNQSQNLLTPNPNQRQSP